jgi:hypothetical protein
MKLSKYISILSALYDKYGDDVMLFQAKDEEGNGYNHVHYAPLECFVPKSEVSDHIVESLIVGPDSEQSREEFLEEHGVTEEELKEDYVLGILL